MKLTEAIKKWARENCGVKEDATDDEYRKAVAEAMTSGSLTAEKFAELSVEPDVDEALGVSKKLDAVMTGMVDLPAQIAKAVGEAMKPKEEAKGGDVAVQDPPPPDPPSGEKGGEGEDDDSIDQAGRKKAPTWYEKMVVKMSGDAVNPGQSIRVKGTWEQYRTEKTALTYPEMTKGGVKGSRPHPLAGQRVVDMGRPLDTASDLDQAISGAFAKFMVNSIKHRSKTLGFQTLPENDRELLYYAMEHADWGGASDGGEFADIKGRKLTELEQKALIDDAPSGGLEAAPIVFDDQVIQTPLLRGELFPLVNLISLDRGRRIEGVITGTVTGGWGGIDDTAISLFNTASYVAAFDTTVHRWEGSIHVGLDFLSDTPIDFNAHITAQYGERLLEDLDDVIAAGNGTNQPLGVLNTSGAVAVNFGGTTSLGNYESLRFGVAKNEHGSNMNPVFVGTETSYQRAMAIPVSATDARRLGGMDYDSYTWMSRPYKINESLSNAEILYVLLARYRMYRRRGLTLRTSTEGDTLIRNNAMLICATARYGGQMERAAAMKHTTTAPA